MRSGYEFQQRNGHSCVSSTVSSSGLVFLSLLSPSVLALLVLLALIISTEPNAVRALYFLFPLQSGTCNTTDALEAHRELLHHGLEGRRDAHYAASTVRTVR